MEKQIIVALQRRSVVGATANHRCVLHDPLKRSRRTAIRMGVREPPASRLSHNSPLFRLPDGSRCRYILCLLFRVESSDERLDCLRGVSCNSSKVNAPFRLPYRLHIEQER